MPAALPCSYLLQQPMNSRPSPCSQKLGLPTDLLRRLGLHDVQIPSQRQVQLTQAAVTVDLAQLLAQVVVADYQAGGLQQAQVTSQWQQAQARLLALSTMLGALQDRVQPGPHLLM